MAGVMSPPAGVLGALQLVCQKLTSKISTLQGSLCSKEQTIRELTTEVAQLKISRGNDMRETCLYSTELDSAMRQTDALHEDAQVLAAHNCELLESNKGLTVKIEDFKVAIWAESKNTYSVSRSNERLHNKIDKLNAKIVELKALVPKGRRGPRPRPITDLGVKHAAPASLHPRLALAFVYVDRAHGHPWHENVYVGLERGQS
jgi:hypothetical protein